MATSNRSTDGSATNASNLHLFWSLTDARVVISDWKIEYNQHRRHSALGYQTPARYAETCTYQ
jgi:putative transposase